MPHRLIAGARQNFVHSGNPGGGNDGTQGFESQGGSPAVHYRSDRGRRRDRNGAADRKRRRRAGSEDQGARAVGKGRRGRDRNAAGTVAARGHTRLRLHGRCDQVARHQVPAGKLRVQLSRHPRVADRLRRQHDARVPQLYARGIRGRHGARLFQDRRQAADDAGSRHGRPAARLDGHFQCVVRSRAGDRRRRQRSGRRPPAARGADHPRRAGHQRAGARLHQMGRQSGLAAAFLAVVRARLQDSDDSALRAGRHVAGCRPAAGADEGPRRKALYPALRADLAAAGRLRRREGSGAAPGRCAESGDRRRSRGAHAGRRGTAGAAWPNSCRRRSSTRAAG